ncbi:hypothetical protein V6N12_045598 [Hibiscus sabdariffa]|uniref:Uncharacterized protein n=1 Tax=Hibiscus sabdariffa TaxID=183260 RepID=A0ABR2G3H5_9ROSI
MPVVNHEAVSLRPRDCSSDLGLLSLKSSRERERQHRERTSTVERRRERGKRRWMVVLGFRINNQNGCEAKQRRLDMARRQQMEWLWWL